MLWSLLPSLLLGVLAMGLGPRGGDDDEDADRTPARWDDDEPNIFGDLVADLYAADPQADVG